jgi:uncharacterized membrane protein YccC
MSPLLLALTSWWGRALIDVRIRWDNLNYEWFSKVVQFNEDDQFLLFHRWGIADLKRLAGVSVATISGFVLLLWLWLRRAKRPKDPAVRLWEKTCAALAKKGLRRAASEAPMTYAARVPAIGELARLYTEHRYGAQPVALSALKEAAARVATAGR